MRLLAFLLIGTLIFGFAFAAAIFLVGLAGLAILALLIAGLLRGGRGARSTLQGAMTFLETEGMRREAPLS
ncbi:MAG: hypothetical protein GXZ00_07265 [Synergistaceae bacterium]|nr:hypothetical protein [Synergistaceae bacterium]